MRIHSLSIAAVVVAACFGETAALVVLEHQWLHVAATGGVSHGCHGRPTLSGDHGEVSRSL
jgi:hypothetical protein